MRGLSGLCGVLAGLWAAVSCSSPAYEDKPLFGELPYPLPSEGSMTQSIAMLKRPYTAFDLLLESGCVTFAEVRCDGASPSNIDLWRFCRQEGHWRQLPSDAYRFERPALCAEFNPAVDTKLERRCVTAYCPKDSPCVIGIGDRRGISEESFCGSHANGSAAGTQDCSWGEWTCKGP